MFLDTDVTTFEASLIKLFPGFQTLALDLKANNNNNSNNTLGWNRAFLSLSLNVLTENDQSFTARGNRGEKSRGGSISVGFRRHLELTLGPNIFSKWDDQQRSLKVSNQSPFAIPRY